MAFAVGGVKQFRVSNKGVCLSPESDQHQISPYNIKYNIKKKVMRSNKMIAKGKMLG